MMTNLLTINEATCSGCGMPRSSGKCSCQRQTRNYQPEPMPFIDWDQIYNQEATQKQSAPQAVKQPANNQQPSEKPQPLGLPVWDYNENFCTGR